MVFLLALFLVFVIPALLLYGVCFVVMMCWRGSALGFVLLSARIGKKNVINCHDLRAGLAIGCKGCPDDWFYGIAYEDESCYLVKRSPSDETIYYLEYEWMRSPIPYASDINHYIALRHQECKERDSAKERHSGQSILIQPECMIVAEMDWMV